MHNRFVFILHYQNLLIFWVEENGEIIDNDLSELNWTRVWHVGSSDDSTRSIIKKLKFRRNFGKFKKINQISCIEFVLNYSKLVKMCRVDIFKNLKTKKKVEKCNFHALIIHYDLKCYIQCFYIFNIMAFTNLYFTCARYFYNGNIF